MTVEEIRAKIDANNTMIQSLFNPSSFVLNNAVLDLMKENDELQKQCTHEFHDGYCIYCYKKEEE